MRIPTWRMRRWRNRPRQVPGTDVTAPAAGALNAPPPGSQKLRVEAVVPPGRSGYLLPLAGPRPLRLTRIDRPASLLSPLRELTSRAPLVARQATSKGEGTGDGARNTGVAGRDRGRVRVQRGDGSGLSREADTRDHPQSTRRQPGYRRPPRRTEDDRALGSSRP